MMDASGPDDHAGPALRFTAGGIENRARGTMVSVRASTDPVTPVILDVYGTGAAMLRLSETEAWLVRVALDRALACVRERTLHGP